MNVKLMPVERRILGAARVRGLVMRQGWYWCGPNIYAPKRVAHLARLGLIDMTDGPALTPAGEEVLRQPARSVASLRQEQRVAARHAA